MDHKMLNLARAKKKLRYFRTEEKNPYALKIKDVFTLNDIDKFFDDLDSSSQSSTPLHSPLYKSTGLIESKSSNHTPEMKPPSSVGVQEPEVLAPENDVQDDHLNDKGSPFKVIAPIKTSSPIDMATAESEAGNGKLDLSPLLFGGEDEEPVEGELRQHPSNQRSRSPQKLFQGDSDSLVSPPTHLEFRKPSNQDLVPVLRGTPLKSSTLPDLDWQTSAPETREELQMSPSPLPPAVLQGSHAGPVEQNQHEEQSQEVKVDTEVKKSAFQQKLRNALQPKPPFFRKRESERQPTRAASPAELDDDFMILEDDAPILFIIPRKPKNSRQGSKAPELPRPSRREGSQLKQTASKPIDAVESCKEDRRAPQTMATVKGGKMCSKNTEAVAQAALVESMESVGTNEEVAFSEQICPTPETSQEAVLPDTGKQRTRNKAKPEQLGKVKDVQAEETSGQKPSSKNKKSPKLSDDSRTRKNLTQEEPDSDVKKKPNTARSRKKTGGFVSAEPSKWGKCRSTTQTNTSKHEEHEDELHDHNESALNTSEPWQVKSTVTAGKKAGKQTASERLTYTRNLTTKGVSERRQGTVAESDRPTEGPARGRRKRHPPGEWWLAVQSNSVIQEQEEVVHQSLQELRFNKRIKRKEAPSGPVDCAQESPQESLRWTQNTATGMRGEAKRSRKPHTDELKSNSTGDHINPKKECGKCKPKTCTASQRKTPSKNPLMTPVLVVGEEVEVCQTVGQFSSMLGSPLKHRSLTPGNKMFDKIYTRRSQSAQKSNPSLLHGPESVLEKMQRKAPGPRWEVLPSLRSPDPSCPPLNCSPARPALRKDPCYGSKVVSSQKMAGHAQKINQKSIISTPKSVRRSLATFNAILASGKAESSTARQVRRKGCRNLLHSLEEQSKFSSENVLGEVPQRTSATFDVCGSVVAMESVTAKKKMVARLSAASRVSDLDTGFKSGPSSMIDLERFEQDEDSDLPSSRTIPQRVPRVLADCDLCGPPLRPIVLEQEDWHNLCVWFTHLWPSSSKNGQAISPDDFHWHSFGGRGMGHMIDVQNNTFSNGKILLGSFMKKPPLVDLNAVTVFNVISSCVRVEIDGAKAVYNSGQTFVTPCGQPYSIHNICREPAILWYNRMLPNHFRN